MFFNIMTDFFITKNNNEQELISFAKKLNIVRFVLLYSFKEYKNIIASNFFSDVEKGIIIEKANVNDILRASQISKYVVVKMDFSYKDKLRSILEKCKGIYIYGIEFHDEFDFVHFRNSGLNHILVNIASDNKIKFLFNFADFLKLDNKKKAIVLGRLKQNMILYNKADVDFDFTSFAIDKYGIKKDLNTIQKLLKSNKVDDCFKNI
jgi:hypothetical protein